MRCEDCGWDLPADARFCSSCGAPVVSDGGEGRIPTEILSTLRGEERFVTVVFADLTESVRRTSELSPEEATGLVEPLLEAMVELMVRHGGRIDRFLGDGVLAVFGIPSAHEDDPIRAVKAAMELRERAGSLGLSITAGINTGRVYFGPVGSTLHEELTVMGPIVNLAARLQSAASADQVLVGESTRAHVEQSFRLSAASLDIKGIDGPVTAYSAEQPTDHPEKVRGIRGLRAEMVGRDTELERLSRYLEDPGGSVALIGPAGVGKSRLAAEFNRRAVQRGARWLEGRCLELTRHVAYGPFVDLLRREFGAADTAASLARRLDELVEAGSLDEQRADEMKDFLGALVAPSTAEPRVQGTDPDQRRRLTVRALVDFSLAVAALGRTVVFLEDLHWSDDASLETVQVLTREGRDLPLLLLLAYRPDTDAPTTDLSARLEPAPHELTLQELSAEDSRTLISRLLKVSGVPPELEERIVTRAAGNPFYVEELIRALIQRGILVRRNRHWEAVVSPEEIPVPESLDGLLMSRFDRLPTPLRQAARVVSVLDDEFDEEFVSALAGDGVASHLPAMAEAGLTSQRRTTPPTYAFLHDLTRQAIYSSLLPSQRGELHGRVGTTLERMHPSGLDRLAHHYLNSSDDDKAVRYALAAAERGMETYAHATALHHLHAGEERIPRLPEERRAAYRARFRARRGEILERQAEHDRARRELLAALKDLDDDPFEEARVWRLVGQTERLQSRFDEAHRSYDRAEEALRRTEDRDSVEAHRAWIEVQQERSQALYFGGRGRELREHNARVAPVVEAHGTVAQRVDLHRAVAMDSFSRDRFALDGGLVEEMRASLELARTGADPGRLATSRFVFGFTLLWADRVEEAAEVLERAIHAAVRVGDVILENRARSYHAVALRRAGEVDAAERAATASLQLSSRLGDDYYRGHALATLCWVAWKRRDGTCRRRGDEAYAAWGPLRRGDHQGLDTEFAWMAVWPSAAHAVGGGDISDAVSNLRHLLVPWERRQPPDLLDAVRTATATADQGTVDSAIQLAIRHRLL